MKKTAIGYKSLISLCLIISMLIGGCTPASSEKEGAGDVVVSKDLIKVGFSQLGAESDRRRANSASIRETFSEEQVLIYYVGASRARLRLDVMVDLTDDECIDILKETLHYAGKIRKPKKDLATALNALGSLNN